MVKEIYVSINAWRKIFALANIAAPKEIIGFLYGEEKEVELKSKKKEKRIYINDVILPKQEVTGCHCEVKIDKTVTDIEHPENIKGLWHSHHTMGSFLSEEDKKTIDNFGADSVQYMLSAVVSLPNTIKIWIKYFKPLEIDVVEIPYIIVWHDQEELYANCQVMFDDKVSEKKWTPNPNLQGATGGGENGIGTTAIKEVGTADDWQKGELPEKPVVEDLTCKYRQLGKNGAYCEIHGKPFICGTKRCLKLLAKKNGEVLDDKAKEFQGCTYSYGCATVKNGVEGCDWQNDFMSCSECGLNRVQVYNHNHSEMA